MLLPTVDEILERAHVVSLPMSVTFRGIRTREALLIDGPKGWGEFSPFLEYEAAEASHWLASGLEAAFHGLPEAHGNVEVNGTIPAVPAAEVPGIVAKYTGVKTFKVKVAEPGQTLQDDIARVNAVREVMPDAILRVDANGAWTVAQAAEAAAKLGELEYMEQPCRTVDELAQLRTLVSTPIAADESIRKASDPYLVDKKVDLAVCKVAPLGGVRRLLHIARTLALDVTVASALDTAVGIHAGAVAAKLAGSRAAGLATQRLFIEDVQEVSLEGGWLPLRAPVPDRERLHGLRAADQRRDWWFERVRACHEVLSEAEVNR